MLAPEADGYWLSHLFVTMSGGFDDTSFGVFREWLASGEREKIVAAARLVEHASGGFVFEHEDFVADLLAAGDRAGAEALEEVRQALTATALNVGGTGTPGEPMPFKLEVQERATVSRSHYNVGTVAEEFYRDLERRATGWLDADRLEWEEREAC